MPKTIKRIKTIQVKLHNLTSIKKKILDESFLNYSKALQYLLDKAHQDIEHIESLSDGKSNKAQAVAKWITGNIGKEINRFNIEPFKDGLKQAFGELMSSYIELKHSDPKTNFPLAYIENEFAIDEYIRLHDELSFLTARDKNDDINDIGCRIKSITKAVGRFQPITMPRYDTSRNYCFLYDADKDRFYVKLYLMNKNSPMKRIFKSNSNLKYINVHEGTFAVKNQPQSFIICPLEFGDWQRNYFELALKNPSMIKTCKLIKDNSDYYLNVSIDFGDIQQRETSSYCGIDRGIKELVYITVVDNEGNILLQESFSGDSYNKLQDIYDTKLQEQARKGNNKHIKYAKVNKAILHEVANRIVSIADEYNSQVIIEKLNIKKSKDAVNASKKFENYNKKSKKTITKKLNKWAFGELEDIINYKLSFKALPKTISINPAYTSEKCSMCGHIEQIASKGKSTNRESQENFLCKKCGYSDNADKNASVNIAKKLIEYEKMPVIVKESFNEETAEYSLRQDLLSLEVKGLDRTVLLPEMISKIYEYVKWYKTIPKAERKNYRKQFAIIKKIEDKENLDQLISIVQ